MQPSTTPPPYDFSFTPEPTPEPKGKKKLIIGFVAVSIIAIGAGAAGISILSSNKVDPTVCFNQKAYQSLVSTLSPDTEDTAGAGQPLYSVGLPPPIDGELAEPTRQDINRIAAAITQLKRSHSDQDVSIQLEASYINEAEKSTAEQNLNQTIVAAEKLGLSPGSFKKVVTKIDSEAVSDDSSSTLHLTLLPKSSNTECR